MMECLPSMHRGLASMSNMEGRKGEREEGREGRKERQRDEQREKRRKEKLSIGAQLSQLTVSGFAVSVTI